MRVRTRREGDSVILEASNEAITVSIENINGNQIRVLFKAPRSVEIPWAEPKKRGPAEEAETGNTKPSLLSDQ